MQYNPIGIKSQPRITCRRKLKEECRFLGKVLEHIVNNQHWGLVLELTCYVLLISLQQLYMTPN